MNEILGNVYLCYKVAKSDKSGNTYNKFMRLSKRFNVWVNSNPNLRADLRDSFLGCDISLDGTHKWFYVTGIGGSAIMHRLDGPAKIVKDREETWYKNGQIHRDDGPADHLYNLGKTLFEFRNSDRASFYYNELFGWYKHNKVDHVDYMLDGKLVCRVMAQDLRSEWYYYISDEKLVCRVMAQDLHANPAKKTFSENIYSLFDYLFS